MLSRRNKNTHANYDVILISPTSIKRLKITKTKIHLFSEKTWRSLKKITTYVQIVNFHI